MRGEQMRQYRVSPDGDSIAIRTDFPEGSWNEWGVMTAGSGGRLASAEEVADWLPLEKRE